MTRSNSTDKKRTAHAGRDAGFVARRGLSSSAELIGALCKAEAAVSNLDAEQFGDLVHARGDQILTALRQRQGVSAERRRQVLAHSDLAKRLRLLLDLADAKNWNGYIPPQVDGYGRLNTSHVRAALVAICHEAAERERADRSATA